MVKRPSEPTNGKCDEPAPRGFWLVDGTPFLGELPESPEPRPLSRWMRLGVFAATLALLFCFATAVRSEARANELECQLTELQLRLDREIQRLEAIQARDR